MKDLEGKVAFITGAGSGIGKQTAQLFASKGASIIVAEINEMEGLATAAQINSSGGEAIYHQTNVADDKSVKEAIEFSERHFGRIDIIFNNAGIIHSQDKDIVSLDVKIWDLTMSINARGVFLGCKYGIPALVRSGGGVIINSSSFTAFLGSAKGSTAYAASKGAVLSLTRELAVRYAKNNIRVNALCPGPIFTEAFSNYFKEDAKKKAYLDRIPLKRFGKPEEVAKAALFLASDDSSYITGSAFMIDGGISAAYLTSE